MRKVKLLFPLMVASLLSSCMLLPGPGGSGSNGGSNGGSNSGGGASGSWSSEIQKEMKQYIGEVLPYAELDTTSLYHVYSDIYADYGFYMYVLGDDNEKDVVKNYGSALKSAGWKEETDTSEGETFIYYTKTINGAELEADFAWYEADTADDGTAIPAGNEIHVYIPIAEE